MDRSQQAGGDVLSSRALQVVDDSKKITNDVDWCDFLLSVSHLAEDRRAVRLFRFARRWFEYMGSGCVRPLYERFFTEVPTYIELDMLNIYLCLYEHGS